MLRLGATGFLEHGNQQRWVERHLKIVSFLLFNHNDTLGSILVPEIFQENMANKTYILLYYFHVPMSWDCLHSDHIELIQKKKLL